MKEKITIFVRDVNGLRAKLNFAGRDEVLNWAENVMTDEDEILIVVQDNICLYSGLQTDKVLTADDITGFFA